MAVIVLVAIAETWGAVSMGKMVHRASNMQYAGGFTKAPRSPPPLFHVVRAYPSVILEAMTRFVGPFQTVSMKLTLSESPSKIEQNIVLDFHSGTVANLIVEDYVGRISDIATDSSGKVTITLDEMKIDDHAAPSMFYPLQHASNFQQTTHGTVVTTMLGN